MPSIYTGPDAATAPLMPCPFREPKNEYEELLLVAEYLLPNNYSQLWHSIVELERLLEGGGLCLPPGFIIEALKRQNRGNRRGYGINKSRLAGSRSPKQTYYLFENEAQRRESGRCKPRYDTPKSQLQVYHGGFSIEDGYFRAYQFKFLSKYLGSSSSTPSAGEAAARGTGEP